MSYYTYSYSEFEPNGKGRFGSIELALESAKEAALLGTAKENTREIFVSLVHETPLRWNTNASEIIGEIEENLCEDSGLDEVYDLVSKDDISALDFMLNECINKWISERQIGRKNGLISWTKQYVFDESAKCYELIGEI